MNDNLPTPTTHRQDKGKRQLVVGKLSPVSPVGELSESVSCRVGKSAVGKLSPHRFFHKIGRFFEKIVIHSSKRNVAKLFESHNSENQKKEQL